MVVRPRYLIKASGCHLEQKYSRNGIQTKHLFPIVKYEAKLVFLPKLYNVQRYHWTLREKASLICVCFISCMGLVPDFIAIWIGQIWLAVLTPTFNHSNFNFCNRCILMLKLERLIVSFKYIRMKIMS